MRIFSDLSKFSSFVAPGPGLMSFENGEFEEILVSPKNFLTNSTNLGHVVLLYLFVSVFFIILNVVKCIISVFMNLVNVEY